MKKARRAELREPRGDKTQIEGRRNRRRPATEKEDRDETNSRRSAIDPTERAGVEFIYGDVEVKGGVPSSPGGARSALALVVVLVAIALIVLSNQAVTIPVLILGLAAMLVIILISVIVLKMKS